MIEDHHHLEIGPAGYSSWQVTDDTGSAAKNPDVHDQVHAVGGQLGLTYVPWLGGRGDRNGSFLRKLGRRRA
jgi:hypothetical protein